MRGRMMGAGGWGLVAALALLAGCGGGGGGAPADGAVDGGVDGAVGPSACEGFVVPARTDTSSCAADALTAAAPDTLAPCLRGSGHAGVWEVDGDGLPAYALTIDQRCDPAGQSWTPRTGEGRSPIDDPVHLIGNGRGVVAMAHASGAVELYTQDRGHKWVNRVDTWRDPQNPDYPVQLGGGFDYVVVGDRVGSTRFEDLPVSEATDRQRRVFGVGYVETHTDLDDVTVDRRVFAPDAEARALVAEVTIRNTTAAPLDVKVVELWDLNIDELVVELLTSDLLAPGITEGLDRRRRALMEKFHQSLSFDPATGTAVARTAADSLPPEVTDRLDVSDTDWFPDPVYLATLDGDVTPDAVWLTDDALWDGPERPIPQAVAGAGDASARTVDIDGAGQHGVLAMRVPVSLDAGEVRTLRFAFGYAPGGGDPAAGVAELRARAATLRQEAVDAWKARMVWAAFPGLPWAGVVQREIAWAAYNTIANATYDEYYGTRLLGQGGSYKYIHGLDGTIGDYCLFAGSVLLIDPDLAHDTLRLALDTQRSTAATLPSGSPDLPGRFPYATTGVGSSSDVGVYDRRSDAYWLVPTSVGRYVGLTRDSAFLDEEVPYWPRAAGESGSVLEHLETTLSFALDESLLGYGAQGMVAMGTGDYADGVLLLADGPTSRTGTSSAYNAGLLVEGLPLAADVVEGRNPALATALRGVVTSQTTALLGPGWQGELFYRGFIDDGSPLAPDLLFEEPQVLPILAGIVSDTQRGTLLDTIAAELETPYGAVSTVELAADAGTTGGIDKPQIAGVWPVANAWLTEAYAMRDPNEGWDSFIRNTLAAHAEQFPDLWYGIWTGPDSFNGPDSDRPGEADAHQATALTDYPALNVHLHTSPLRALMGLLGIEGTAAGLRIAPRVPTETFTVVWPRLTLESRPDHVGGTLTVSATGPVELRVAVPSGIDPAAGAQLTVDGAPAPAPTFAGSEAVFVVDATAGAPVAWSLDPP